MTSRTWFWKIAVSLSALAVAWFEFHPIAPIPLDQFVPAQVIAQKTEFDKLHAEALERVKHYKDAAVAADKKSVSYFQALRDIGDGMVAPLRSTSVRSSSPKPRSCASPIRPSATGSYSSS
jgi:hypothetical protein